MSKVSTNNITSLDQDWGYDPSNGLPFSGAKVQQFIKEKLGSIPGSCHFDPTNNKIYWFESEEAKQRYIADNSLHDLVLFSTTMEFTSDLYRMYLTNNNNTTTINAATNESVINISIDFDVQHKTISDQAWSSTLTGAKVTVYLDKGAGGEYEILRPTAIYQAGETFNLNVRNDIVAGSNRLRVTFVSEDNPDITSSITYVINLTEMYIELLNNEWYIPIIEGGDPSAYKLGGFRIIGALNKTLHLDIYSGEDKVAAFSAPIGVTAYDRIGYYYTSAAGLDFTNTLSGTPLTTGVYLVSAYLTSGSLTTSAVNYNIMYITAEDAGSVQLICINEVSDVAYNYTTSNVFKYSIYNHGSLTGSPTIVTNKLLGTTPILLESKTLSNVATATPQIYNVQLEWITEESVNLYLSSTMTYGNIQTVTVPVDNSFTYPPTSGYDFYINTAARDNSDLNREKIINTKTNGELTPTWERMAWVNGVDGWTIDSTGRKCLYIPASSSMVLPYTEYRILSGEGISVELCYKVSNVADYNEVVMSIAENIASSGFTGIRIKPTNITIHSSEDVTGNNDLVRGTNLMDEEIVHFVLTICPNFNGNVGRNVVTGYINGCKNFQFDYAVGTLWSINGDFKIGCEKSDVALYFIRKYNSVLSEAMVQSNYISSLGTIEAREDMSRVLNSIMDANGTNISYENVKNTGKNFFVLEMLDGASVPSRANGWTKDTNLAARSNLEMHFGEHPDWDWKIYNVETMGQGTTSMGYYRWNLRWRIDKSSGKKVNASYLDTRSLKGNSYSYIWGDTSNVGSIYFDGVNNHPALKRMTAKINFASSMQSHKIGATRAYTELHDALGLQNEAQEFADNNNLPMPTVAVYEYPAYGFAKVGDEYTFIGLFTIGPDKGDKPTFGYNIDNSIADNLITMEGTDHSRKMVMFNYPWNDTVDYLYSNECINIVKGINDYDNGWEVGNCHGYSTDDSADEADINTVLETEFKPAYEIAFNNSTLIIGIPLGTYGETAEETLNYINSNVASFQGILDSNSRMTYANYQFWIEGEYILYYYDIKDNIYKPDIDLVEQNGVPEGNTVVEQNEWFKTQRRARFKASAEDYWDIQDTLFHYAFLIIYGAIDNFGKNTYPYKMATLSDGGRWKWRQDDLDSILGIGNAGADNMPAWIEFEDSSNGAVYFSGSNSVFWNLIHECYKDDYVSTVEHNTKFGFISVGRAILTAMAQIAGGNNALNGIMQYIKLRFWDNAQNYFPQSAYNADSVIKYEAAWLANDNQQAEPLTQSLGNHYSAEYFWVYRRMIYMMSMFKVGPFANYADTTMGQIAFRPQNIQSLTVTPAIPLYPALSTGQGMVSTARTMGGETYTFTGPFGDASGTTHYIQASNWLSSLGDLKNFTYHPNYTQTLAINGSKLTSLKIGDKVPENVTTNVPGLSFTNTPCIETIDARNASSITGTVDVSACSRLKSAYFEGSSVTQVNLADGQKIETLHLPNTATNVVLKDLKFLDEEHFEMPENPSNIQLLSVEGCIINAFALLQEVFNSNNAKIRYISISSPDTLNVSSSVIEMLSKIVRNLDKDGNELAYTYGSVVNGAPNPTALPVVDVTLKLITPFYEQDLEILSTNGPEDYGIGKRLLSDKLVGLTILYDPTVVYIPFADNLAKNICTTNWGSDGYITTAQAAAVTSVTTQFNNSQMTSFNEFKYFTGVKTLAAATGSNSPFYNCTSLKSVMLPEGLTSTGTSGGTNRIFAGCSALEEIGFPSTLTSITGNAFYSTNGPLAKLHIKDIDSYLRINFVASSSNPFYASTADTRGLYIDGNLITQVNIPENITAIKNFTFYRNNTLQTISLHNDITSIGTASFEECRALTGSFTLPTNLRTIGERAFKNCTALASTITLPSTLTSIGDSAFEGCSNIEGTLSIPSGFVSIGASAFKSCYKLNGELVFPETTTSIGNYAFQGTKITKVTIPNTVTTIGEDPFISCTRLVDYYNYRDNATLKELGNLTTSVVGDGTGTMYFKGNVTNFGGTTGMQFRFKRMIFDGNVSGGYSTAVVGAIANAKTYTKEVRFRGNFSSTTSNTNYYCIGASHNAALDSDFEFLEILGSVTASRPFFANQAYIIKSNFIIHLGYNGVATTPTIACAGHSRVGKIYVGSGESEAADQAVLDQYLADSAWANYASKLDLWYNYEGEYKE